MEKVFMMSNLVHFQETFTYYIALKHKLILNEYDDNHAENYESQTCGYYHSIFPKCFKKNTTHRHISMGAQYQHYFHHGCLSTES